MSRVVVCDRCSETALLEHDSWGSLSAPPQGWVKVDYESDTDLCSHCYKEFQTEFLGVQKKILGKK